MTLADVAVDGCDETAAAAVVVVVAAAAVAAEAPFVYHGMSCAESLWGCCFSQKKGQVKKANCGGLSHQTEVPSCPS